MPSGTTSDTANGAVSSQEGWELGLNLFRIFPLKITFPDITKREKQQELAQQVMDFQEDFLRKMHVFQENFMNFHKTLQQVSLRIKTYQGYKIRTIRDLRKEHPELTRFYYDTLDTIIDIYPHLPPVRFIIPDHGIVSLVREFEREAHAVYVSPFKTITGSLLFDIYRIWTEDGLVYLPTYLSMHAAELGKTDLVRLKLRMVGPLESKAVFNRDFDSERICTLINAIQGQIGGHVNRLFGLMRSRELTTYLKDSLKRIKDNILPEVMTTVRPDLEEALVVEERILNARGAKERVCLKDDLMENARLLFSIDLRFQDELDASVFEDLDGNILPEALQQVFRANEIQLSPNAPITAAWKGREWILTDQENARYIISKERHRLEVFTESPLNRAHRLIARLMTDEDGALPTAEIVQTIVNLLERFTRRVRELPSGTLVRKHFLIRNELRRSLSLIDTVLDRYIQVYEKAYKAIHPFMGMVSFAPGGMSDFYVKWFAGLRDFLAFEVPMFRERSRPIQQAIDSERWVYKGSEKIAENLMSVIAPEVAAGLSYSRLAPENEEDEPTADEDPDPLSHVELAEMLADYYCLISYVHSLPRELYRIERDIFYNLRKKRTFALKLIRYGRADRRRKDNAR